MNSTPLRAILRICTTVATTTFLTLLTLAPLSATVITFPISTEYSAGTAPVGTAPWLTAIFDDENTPGTVKLKLVATNLTGSEFVSEWNFNLNPALSPTNIAFSAPIKTGGNGFDTPTISKLINSFSAGPDGSYDIEFSFATSNSGGGTRRFGVGEMAEYVITGSGPAAGLVAADFNFLSQTGNTGVGGPYRTGAHVQSIGGSNSGWVTVDPSFNPFGIPEPTTLVLLALSLGTASLSRKRL